MLKGIPIGIEDFKKIRETDCYYIDKTKFIEDILIDRTEVKLFCRPRRFGKTLNMYTLKYFFDVRNREENKKLFNGLYIENSPMMKEQGKYPVIFISMKGLGGLNWDVSLGGIKAKIKDLFREYIFLTETLDKYTLLEFEKYLISDFDEISTRKALKFLTEVLYKHYHQKVIILIDEYDSPIISAYESGYYNEMREFLKVFYGEALKTNEYLYMGVLTGIIRVAQAGIFSDLNNFISYTTLENTYSQSFGLIEEEVKTILDYYELGYEMPEVKKWYDGYSFGKEEIYNPWSILNFVKERELKSYWINTSSNFMIRELLKHTGEEGLETLEKIFNQEDVAVRITDNVRFGSNLSASEVWELMVYSGYLTIKNKLNDGRYRVRIPNMEIMKFFKDEFLTIIFGEYRVVDELRDALNDKNLKQLDRLIEKLILDVMSFHDTDKRYENSYHMLLAGFFYALDDYYTVKSNIESGYGRADIILFPKNQTKAGYIFELKRANTKDIEKEVQKALLQINIKKYYTELEKHGVKEIIKIGYVFDGKKVISSNN
ncbi:AAA family ATPase [uncultured Fusobacterium sp.]|uniref:AAA family ATPase n=1 Tax=uncultured Fusobacterium sp. TaxID=159267 RepID=UPI0026130A28|nr:AAA family ATPase [uncultured Fusobacterium sp.]